MKTCGIFAASLFGALVAAVPLNKRDVVWVTETNVDVVTMPVTKTVWVGADEASSTSASVSAANGFHGHAHRPKSRHTWQTYSMTSSTVVSPSPSSVYVAPTTSSTSVYVEPTNSSTSVYVAPTTSSTSVYVAPTTSSTSVYVAPTTSSTSVYFAPTTSSTSVYVAPTTSSTSVYVAPTTTEAPSSTSIAASSTSSTAAATSSASSSSGLAAAGTSYSGDLTYFATGLGACGWTNTDSEAIVAISEDIFDAAEFETANPNDNPLCGRKISITGMDGTQYAAKVVDRCVGCSMASIDVTTSLFSTLSNGDLALGRISGTDWTWM